MNGGRYGRDRLHERVRLAEGQSGLRHRQGQERGVPHRREANAILFRVLRGLPEQGRVANTYIEAVWDLLGAVLHADTIDTV